MHEFDFHCEGCTHTFSKTLSVDAYQAGGVICPRCGSERVERRFSPVARNLHSANCSGSGSPSRV